MNRNQHRADLLQVPSPAEGVLDRVNDRASLAGAGLAARFTDVPRPGRLARADRPYEQVSADGPSSSWRHRLQ